MYFITYSKLPQQPSVHSQFLKNESSQIRAENNPCLYLTLVAFVSDLTWQQLKKLRHTSYAFRKTSTLCRLVVSMTSIVMGFLTGLIPFCGAILKSKQTAVGYPHIAPRGHVLPGRLIL